MRNLVVFRGSNWLILLVVSWTWGDSSMRTLVFVFLFYWGKGPRLISILTLICRIEVSCSLVRHRPLSLAVILNRRSWPWFRSQRLCRRHVALRSHSFNKFSNLYRIRWRSLSWFKRGVHRRTNATSDQVLSQGRPLPWRNPPWVIHGFLLHFKPLPFMMLACFRLISAIPPCESLFHLLCCRPHLCKLALFEGDPPPQFLLAL